MEAAEKSLVGIDLTLTVGSSAFSQEQDDALRCYLNIRLT
jgi:hypothetical protein